jgi:hypothetical protein
MYDIRYDIRYDIIQNILHIKYEIKYVIMSVCRISFLVSYILFTRFLEKSCAKIMITYNFVIENIVSYICMIIVIS